MWLYLKFRTYWKARFCLLRELFFSFLFFKLKLSIFILFLFCFKTSLDILSVTQILTSSHLCLSPILFLSNLGYSSARLDIRMVGASLCSIFLLDLFLFFCLFFAKIFRPILTFYFNTCFVLFNYLHCCRHISSQRKRFFLL